MTSKLTRERIELIANFHRAMTLPPSHDEIEELARMALAALDSEPSRNPVLAYADSYRDMAKQGVESVPIWSVITDLERNIAPLYRHTQPAPVVQENSDPRDAFEAVFPMPKHAQRCGDGYAVTSYGAWTAYEFVKKWEGWNACRAAMLQAGNSPVIPDGLIAAVNRLLDTDGSRGCYSAIRCYDAHDEIERLLAAAPQEVKGEHRIRDEMDMGARITSHRFKV